MKSGLILESLGGAPESSGEHDEAYRVK